MPKTEDYSIDLANEEDVIDLVILGKEFAKEAQVGFLGWSNDKVSRSLSDAIARDDFLVVVMRHRTEAVGMLVAFVTPCFFSDAMQAVEIVWYATPEHRGTKGAHRMVEHYEKWAKEAGAVCTNLSNLDILKADRVRKLYERKGYRLTENTFIKRL